MRVTAILLILSAPVFAQVPWAESQPVGIGTPGLQGVPLLQLDGLPAVDQPAPGLRIVNGRPDAPAQLVVGLATGPAFLPKYGATLYPEPLLRLTTTLDATGASPPFLPLPSVTPAALLGEAFTLQGLVADGRAKGGMAFTAGLELVFGLGSAAAPLYPEPRAFLVPHPAALALGDLDEDGRLDAATANADGSVTIALASPHGLYAIAGLEAGGTEAVDIQLADLDGDGHLDLVVAQRASPIGLGRLGVRLGLGDGGFGPLATYATGADCFAVAVADVDADGHLDLLATRTKGLAVFLGQGNGTFGPIWAIFLPTFAFEPRGLAVAEITGDAQLDVLVEAVGSSALLVSEGAGDGTFAPPVEWSLDFHAARALAVGDVDGNGRADAVVGAVPVTSPDSNGAVLVLPGQPGGGFGAPVVTQLPLTPVVDLALGLMDGDPFLDVVVARNDATTPFFPIPELAILPGTGNGAFAPASSTRRLPVDDLVVADVDGDGALDVAGVGAESHVVHVVRGDGDSGFVPFPGTIGVPDVGAVIAVTDLDADGDVDVLALAASATALRVVAGDGAGGFADAGTVPLGPWNWDFEVADVNDDGLPDLVLIGFHTEDGIAVLLNLGGLAFAPPLVTPAPAGLFELGHVVAGRLDGDEHVDLLLHAFVNVNKSRLFVLKGAGDGSFTVVDTEDVVGGTYYDVALGDVDADGQLDAVGTIFGEPEFGWHRGGGDGTLGPGTLVTVPKQPGYVTAAQVDGLPGDDLVLTPQTAFGGDGDSLQIVRSLGGGAFATDVYVAPERLSPADVGDVNGDGATDIVGGSSVDGCIAVWLGVGGGAFVPAQPFLSGFGVLPRFGDADGDGRLEIFGGAGEVGLVVVENLGG